MFLVILQVVTVIKRNFLAGLDVPQRPDPDAALFAKGLAIRRATVIEKTRRIPFDISVQIEFLVEAENKPVLRLAAMQRFRLGDALSNVFDDTRPFAQKPRGKSAPPMNGGRRDSNVVQSGSHTA